MVQIINRMCSFLCILVRRENLLRLDQRRNLQKRSEIFKFLTHLTLNLHGRCLLEERRRLVYFAALKSLKKLTLKVSGP